MRPAIVITGAAGGIGEAFVRVTAAEGMSLLLLDRARAPLEALATELRAAGYDANALTVDLALPGSGEVVVQALAAHGLQCEVLVNNAGRSLVGPTVNHELATQLEVVDLHVRAVTDLTFRLLPKMMEQGRGGVINVSSMGAYMPGPNMAIYNATKRYVHVFTAHLRREVAGSGVSVCCLVPGKVRTGMWPETSDGRRHLVDWLPMAGAPETAAAGWQAFRRGRAVVVPQPFFRLASVLMAAIPTSAYLLLTAGMFGRAIHDPASIERRRPAAVVTGASSRAGRELAQLAAREVSEVVLVGRAVGALESLRTTIEAQGGRAHIVIVDLLDPDAGEQVERALDEHGLYCDVLVYGARLQPGRGEPLELVTVNVRALTELTLRFLPGLAARGRGGVLLFGSTDRAEQQDGSAVLRASTAYATWLAEALAIELRPVGVTVTRALFKEAGSSPTATPKEAARHVWRAFRHGKPSVRI